MFRLQSLSFHTVGAHAAATQATGPCAKRSSEIFLTFTKKSVIMMTNKTDRQKKGPYLSAFMHRTIADLTVAGKTRTAETYSSALNSFRRFLGDRDIRIGNITDNLTLCYQAWLKDCGLCPNSTSFYMRILRAVYNRAADEGLIAQRRPFTRVYTGVDKTIKRAISLNTIRKVKEIRLDDRPDLAFARDIFLFSFYTRGMSFVDIAYLKKKNLKYGTLTYRRQKTGQTLKVKWEDCMQKIVDKYADRDSAYILPIITGGSKDMARNEYLKMSHRVNRLLKKIGQMAGTQIPLTMYVARHTWASIARNSHIPLQIISEGMGHNSESTTRIYLSEIDTSEIDKANRQIIRLI